MDYVQQRVALEAKRLAEKPPTETRFLTPLNFFIVTLILYTVYRIVRPTPPPPVPKEAPPIVFRTFTPKTLLEFDGVDGKPVYLAVRGRVFDVSAGRNFYGPGGPYENFAGRDASRGLANHSFDEEMLTKDLDGPLYDLNKLGPDERDALRDWEERFESKYLIVGRLVPASEAGEKA